MQTVEVYNESLKSLIDSERVFSSLLPRNMKKAVLDKFNGTEKASIDFIEDNNQLISNLGLTFTPGQNLNITSLNGRGTY